MAGNETFEKGFNDRLKEVSCPTVLACGSNVGEVNGVSQAADLFAERFRNGRQERYGDLTHFGPFERPDFIAERFLAFVERDVNVTDGISTFPRYLHVNTRCKL